MAGKEYVKQHSAEGESIMLPNLSNLVGSSALAVDLLA